MATIQTPSPTEAEPEAPLEPVVEPENQPEVGAKLKPATVPMTPVVAILELETLLEQQAWVKTHHDPEG